MKTITIEEDESFLVLVKRRAPTHARSVLHSEVFFCKYAPAETNDLSNEKVPRLVVTHLIIPD